MCVGVGVMTAFVGWRLDGLSVDFVSFFGFGMRGGGWCGIVVLFWDGFWLCGGGFSMCGDGVSGVGRWWGGESESGV